MSRMHRRRRAAKLALLLACAPLALPLQGCNAQMLQQMMPVLTALMSAMKGASASPSPAGAAARPPTSPIGGVVTTPGRANPGSAATLGGFPTASQIPFGLPVARGQVDPIAALLGGS